MSDRWVTEMINDPVLTRFCQEALPAIRAAFSPEKVLVFGSRVRGRAHADSDIDTIIIAEAFRGIPFVNRAAFVMRSAKFDRHVAYLCYTPDEYERTKNRSIILRDAAAYAVDVTG